MPEANDVQMQQFANERLRPRAEQLRHMRASCVDDKAAIDDIYARAVGNKPWEDSREDGPPHLLQAGSSSAPDDILNFNSAITLVEKFFAGTFSSLEEANSFSANWAVLQDACVRPIGT